MDVVNTFKMIFRLKSLSKKVKQTLDSREEQIVERRRKRVLRRFISTKRLGHGKFVEYKEPVLLPNEIKGNMLSIKPQGSILRGMYWFSYSYVNLFRANEESSKAQHASA